MDITNPVSIIDIKKTAKALEILLYTYTEEEKERSRIFGERMNSGNEKIIGDVRAENMEKMALEESDGHFDLPNKIMDIFSIKRKELKFVKNALALTKEISENLENVKNPED